MNSRCLALPALLFVGCTSAPENSKPESGNAESTPPESPLVIESPGTAPPGMVWIPGGTYVMGSDDGLPDEQPRHTIRLDGYWMDKTEVTNSQFKKFVDATGYVTVAEKTPSPADFPGVDPKSLVAGALVLVKRAQIGYEWKFVGGANWKHPAGPGSSIDGLDEHPVVHVCWDDAKAYADWCGKSLPTEAQFEYAARSGDSGRPYVWKGHEMTPGGKYMANTWQGEFPLSNSGADQFLTTAPVGSFPANDFGLYDMAGNVWEWCADLYRPDAYSSQDGMRNPAGPKTSVDPQEPGTQKRVVRGGSFLCSSNYCAGYRPTARMKSSPDTGLFHTGFRCVASGTDAPPRDRSQ